MIQDIAPHRYDNTYHIQKPGAQDYVFCIQKGRILLRETAEEHVLTIPRREEIEAAVPELMDRAVYLFSVDEKPYFLVSVRSSIVAIAISTALPNPTIPAVFSVPPRRLRSCAPPWMKERVFNPVRI